MAATDLLGMHRMRRLGHAGRPVQDFKQALAAGRCFCVLVTMRLMDSSRA